MRKSNKLKQATRKHERRNKRPNARPAQNHRSPIIKMENRNVSPLDRLAENFRNSVHWTPPRNEGEVTHDPDNQVVAMFRLPPIPNPRLDNQFVAVNSKTYDDDEDPLEHQQGLQELLWQDVFESIRPTPIDFVKSGGAIWDHIGIEVVRDLVEGVVSVHDIDDDTYRAVNAALFTAYNTSAAPPDMETVAVALATFIHAHPHFKDIADQGEFLQPYGDDTFWKLLKPFKY